MLNCMTRMLHIHTAVLSYTAEVAGSLTMAPIARAAITYDRWPAMTYGHDKTLPKYQLSVYI